jgi:hypothetical protein
VGVTNGGFEDGTFGAATGWTHTIVGTLEDYAKFGGVNGFGVEDFGIFWTGSEVLTEFVGFYSDIEPAIFSAGPGQEAHDSFEKGWGAILMLELSQTEAMFDAGSNDEDGFEGWWTLDLSPSTSLAMFDAGSNDEDGFEGWWTLDLSPSTSLAMFDAGANGYESFEDPGWPALP